ncbi:MAG: flavodoxin family protein [Spirochaetia bacterium]
MKVLAICGSPRKNKTTRYMLGRAIQALSKERPGLEIEIIDLAGLAINGCISCGQCRNGLECSQKDDFLSLIPKLTDSQVKGILFASPVYLGSMTSQLKAFLDRSVMIRRNGFLWKNKLAAALAVGGSRNGGQEITIQGIHAACLIQDMILVGDGNTTSHFGGTMYSKEGIENDVFGAETADNTGKRFGQALAVLK